MSVTNDELRRRLDRFQQELKRAGMKLTHQRIVVFEEVARTDEHPDAEKIYDAVRRRIPTVSLDTVYRTLWLLRDLGLIATLGPPREKARFDANTRRHHHFVCTKCGMATDFYSPEFDDLPIPDEVRSVGNVQTAHVEMRGLCSRCFENGSLGRKE